MKKIFFFLCGILMTLFIAHPINTSPNTSIRKMRLNDTSQSTSSEENSSSSDNALTAIYTGTGIVATGGAGALVIGVGMKTKKKDTPSKEIKAEDREDL